MKTILYFLSFAILLVGCSSAPEPVKLPTDPATAKFIEGVVEVAPELAEQAKATPGAALFLFVRVPNQPGPPMATLRTDLIAFPYKFVISEANGMGGSTADFSGPLTVHARLSKRGNPVGAPGDLETDSKPEPVTGGATGVRLILNKVVAEKRPSPVTPPAGPNPYE